ncbi:hypothetical protein [Kamptonema formosum]|uniref:hypothetical protein n=1 Tax=Kamptonema formosum TaxID=331992 RepID=UPI0003484B1D|nr:hypothetical protein [Oscillatoria sp. PCC 10802]
MVFSPCGQSVVLAGTLSGWLFGAVRAGIAGTAQPSLTGMAMAQWATPSRAFRPLRPEASLSPWAVI